MIVRLLIQTGRPLAQLRAADLDELAAACGGARRVVVCRELTKLHEEFLRGTPAELLALAGVEVAFEEAACAGWNDSYCFG